MKSIIMCVLSLCIASCQNQLSIGAYKCMALKNGVTIVRYDGNLVCLVNALKIYPGLRNDLSNTHDQGDL